MYPLQSDAINANCLGTTEVNASGMQSTADAAVGMTTYNCPNREILKCANCGQGHSDAYRMCSKYKEMQLALEIRAYDNIPLGDAL